jgi:4-amino-4-deoxy-L-arabinose transferase-like glycosyltransferase
VDWADIIVIPITLVLSVPALLWFAHHWTIIGNDSARYLLAASQLISGQALDDLKSISEFNGGHGPAFPAMLGALIVIFGRDTEELVWTVRLMALLNPLLAYLLARRLWGAVAGLIAAALVALLTSNTASTSALNIDIPLLTFYLLALLALLAAIGSNSPPPAILSGTLLGISILTKETALANAPLALLAVLLLGWNVRGALWHYMGVALVCLPWWVWAYSATGEVYLHDRLPASLQVPVLIAAAILLLGVALAYASGLLFRFLADERRCRWTGWSVVIAWSVALTGMLLATASRPLNSASLEALGAYLADLLAPAVVVVPALVMVVCYVCWKALRHDAEWKLLAVALLFQVPVCLLVVVEHWSVRQFLIPQTLLLCALAVLVVDAGDAALARRRDHLVRLIGAFVATTLTILLLVACVGRVEALLPESPVGSLTVERRVAPQKAHMVDWLAENVTQGEHILINAAQANYIVFLDGGRHEVTKLQLDQGICVPRPNIQVRCDPDENDLARIPPDALWVQMLGGCRVISLSMPNLLEQVRQTGSGYVMISSSFKYPGILELPSLLQKSGAFKVVHAEGHSGTHGVVLLKSTGRAPEAVPTLINRNTVVNLERCEQAKGQEDYTSWLRSKFPNGILEVAA